MSLPSHLGIIWICPLPLLHAGSDQRGPSPPSPTVQELVDDWQQRQSRNDKADFKEHPAVLRDLTAPFSMGPKITGGQAEVGGLGLVERSWEGWRGSFM